MPFENTHTYLEGFKDPYKKWIKAKYKTHTKEGKNNKPTFEKEMNIKANVKYNFKLKLEKIV